MTPIVRFFICPIILFLVVISCKKEEPEEVYSGTWKSISSLPSKGRTFAIGFSLLGKGYVGGGQTGQRYGNAPNSDTLYDFWMYNADADSWVQKNNIPFSFVNCLSSSVNDKGYVLTYSTSHTKVESFWKYDPAMDQWTLLKAPAIQVSLNGSSKFASFTIDKKIYYYFDKNLFYEYNPLVDTWTLKAQFPGNSRRYPHGLSVGSFGYLGFGFATQTADKYRDFYRYNPSTDKWERMADYPQESLEPNISYCNDQNGFIQEYGASSISHGPCKIYQYTPSSNSWSRKANFKRNIRNMAVFTINNRIFVGTGEALEPEFTNGTTFAKGTNEFWEFIP
jgi:N-acetylneuraminic acid mutarotase